MALFLRSFALRIYKFLFSSLVISAGPANIIEHKKKKKEDVI